MDTSSTSPLRNVLYSLQESLPSPLGGASSIDFPLSSPAPELLDGLDQDDLDIDQDEEMDEGTAEETADYPKFRTREKLHYMADALEHIG